MVNVNVIQSEISDHFALVIGVSEVSPVISESQDRMVGDLRTENIKELIHIL